MRIVCLGDSVTAGLGVSREESWVHLLSRETDICWSPAGVVGDTLPGMLSRLDCEILPQRPDGVFLLGGWNDLLLSTGQESARACIMAMIHHCAHAGLKVYLGIPYPVEAVPPQWQSLCQGPENFSAYLDWLRRLIQVFHLRSVDLAAAFAGRPELLLDGLHPNAAGHRVIADTIKKTILERKDR